MSVIQYMYMFTVIVGELFAIMKYLRFYFRTILLFLTKSKAVKITMIDCLFQGRRHLIIKGLFTAIPFNFFKGLTGVGSFISVKRINSIKISPNY